MQQFLFHTVLYDHANRKLQKKHFRTFDQEALNFDKNK